MAHFSARMLHTGFKVAMMLGLTLTVIALFATAHRHHAGARRPLDRGPDACLHLSPTGSCGGNLIRRTS
ncbi:hypothetical protein [Tanticharoenia sakaeratensis]|uniref:hypothetical protein n=1 Tax=Tanticharoenia sakaeratensis TaxID=444053 RepID=UPI0006623A9C|nr:hypothetical protein [Tanticharoenia sakaeratensis]